MTRNLIFESILNSIKKSLDSESFMQEFRKPNRFIRRRLLRMKDVAQYLIFHKKTSHDISWNSFRSKFEEFKIPDVSKQAICKARDGISYLLFQEFFNLSVERFYYLYKKRKKWIERYHLFAIDGSDFEVPSSEETFEEFGKNFDPKKPDLFWSMAKTSMLYDVSEDIIVDAVIDKQASHERDMAMKHLARMADLDITPNAVVIYDRGYYSSDMFMECHNTGCKCLMRLRKCMKFCKLPGDDVIASVLAPDGSKIPCRVLKVELSTGEIEYLITDIMDEDITCDDFRDLYFERWKIETKYEELKERSKIEEFTGKKPCSVRQDFYISMLLANLAGLIKSAADVKIAANARSTNRFKYQARRTYIIGRVKEVVPEMLMKGVSLVKIDELIESASKKKSQIQPGRSYTRRKKKRARKHYDNRKATF